MQVTPFGRELKRMRAEHKLTTRDLSDRLSKSVAYLGKIEAQGEIPNPELIERIAAVFETDAKPLFALAKQSLLAHVEREIDARFAAPIKNSSQKNERILEENHKKMAIVLSNINMKGGVGKTTLAMQLAHAADTAGLRVLAVDLDPQSNLSQALMGAREYREHLRTNGPTICQIFDGYVPAGADTGAPHKLDVDDVILVAVGPRSNSSLDLIPSRLELSRTLKNPTGKERRLAKALAQVQDEYDLIIIDCAPTESILTEAAYFASRYLIVPIKPEFMATIGLPLLARSLAEFRLENEDHELEIAGLVFNHSSAYSSGPEGQRSIKEVTDFAENEGWYLCENQMKYSASYAKAAREGTSLSRTSYARWDVISGFQRLKDEIFHVVGLNVAPQQQVSS
jgi:chromosome partitioning protein